MPPELRSLLSLILSELASRRTPGTPSVAGVDLAGVVPVRRMAPGVAPVVTVGGLSCPLDCSRWP